MWAARSVALQGVGGSAMQGALQGFFAPAQVEEPEYVSIPFGGGMSWEARRKLRRRREDEELLILLGR